MKPLRWWPVLVVAALTLISLGVLIWGAYGLKQLHDCLDNGNFPATITERGCELHVGSRTILEPVTGPGFGGTLVAGASTALLLTTLLVLLVRRLWRGISARA